PTPHRATTPATSCKPSSTSLSQVTSGRGSHEGVSMQRRLISSDGPVPVVEGLSFPKDASFLSMGTIETSKGTVEVFSVHAKEKPLGVLRILPATGEARFTPATR